MKEKLITRTTYTTNVKVLGLDIVEAQPKVVDLTIAGEYRDESTILKIVKAKHDTDIFKCVAIQGFAVVEKLYGATEQEFLSIAKELPPRKIYDKAE